MKADTSLKFMSSDLFYAARIENFRQSPNTRHKTCSRTTCSAYHIRTLWKCTWFI